MCMFPQGTKPAAGFQTARSAFAAELRKTGRQLPLQLKSAQQESEARQGKAAQKKGGSSAAAMFPEGQGAFNSTTAPRQGLLKGRGSKRPDTGEAMLVLLLMGFLCCIDALLALP